MNGNLLCLPFQCLAYVTLLNVLGTIPVAVGVYQTCIPFYGCCMDGLHSVYPFICYCTLEPFLFLAVANKAAMNIFV